MKKRKERFIVKVQCSLTSADDVARCLAYNEDRSVMVEHELTPALAQLFKVDEWKIFCWATLRNGGRDLDIGHRAPWQEW